MVWTSCRRCWLGLDHGTNDGEYRQREALEFVPSPQVNFAIIFSDSEPAELEAGTVGLQRRRPKATMAP